MRAVRKVTSVFTSRVRRKVAFAICVPLVMIAALAAAPTAVSAATSSTAAVSATTAAAAASVCGNPPLAIENSYFYRCTPTAWVGIKCSTYNNNAGTSFNVIYSENTCIYRVWLHQYKYPQWQSSGWSYCIDPVQYPGIYVPTPSQYAHPENIYISTNESAC